MKTKKSKSGKVSQILLTSWSTYCKRYVHPVKSDGSSLTAFQYFSNSGNVFFFGDAGFISCLSPASVSLDKATFFAGVSSLFSEVGELGSYSPSAFNLRLAENMKESCNRIFSFLWWKYCNTWSDLLTSTFGFDFLLRGFSRWLCFSFFVTVRW